MVISVKETTVFSVFHPDAQDLYNTCSDLKKVAYELWDPSFRLNASVRLLNRFWPDQCLLLTNAGQGCTAIPCLRAYVMQTSHEKNWRNRAWDGWLRVSHWGEAWWRENAAPQAGERIFLLLSVCYVFYPPLFFDAKRLVGKARTTPTSMASTLEPEVWHPSSTRRSILV